MLSYKRFIAGVLLGIVITIVPAQAITMEEIVAESDGKLAVVNGKLASRAFNSVGDLEDTAMDEAAQAITATTRVGDKAEAIEQGILTVDEVGKYHVSFAGYQVNDLIDHVNYVNGWVEKNIPKIVHEGMNREDAIRAVYDYIVSHFAYDFEACATADGSKVLREAQGAYYMLAHGKGVCASFAKLFRGLVEAIPFNQNGVVDYSVNPDSTNYIQVAIVHDDDNAHEWNAICGADGKWYHYDTASAAASGGEFFAMTETEFKTMFHDPSVSIIYEY